MGNAGGAAGGHKSEVGGQMDEDAHLKMMQSSSSIDIDKASYSNLSKEISRKRKLQEKSQQPS